MVTAIIKSSTSNLAVIASAFPVKIQYLLQNQCHQVIEILTHSVPVTASKYKQTNLTTYL